MTRWMLVTGILVFPMLLASCGGRQAAEVAETPSPVVNKYEVLQQASWLIGSWRMNDREGALYEVWRKTDDSTMDGASFFVAGKDTVPQETIQLQVRHQVLRYVPTLHHRDGSTSVVFTQVGSSMVFENQTHDFPQRISYVQVGTDSLYAEISGTQNGKERKEGFPMVRISGQ